MEVSASLAGLPIGFLFICPLTFSKNIQESMKNQKIIK
ncbi:hypothetical protein HMPREF9176_2166 [Streptococcus downei F0415]|nr:hypothetical protein HMPREF9176_2166 [Streptococcus downei F0415]